MALIPNTNGGRQVCVLGVPSAFGQACTGVSLAPQALRKAGLIDRLQEQGLQVQDCGDLLPKNSRKRPAGPEKPNNLGAVADFSKELCLYLNAAMSRGGNKIPLILGGDHSVSIGSIAAFANHFPNLGVIWFDAHPDLNTPKTSPSGNIHGMSLAVSLGVGHPRLLEIGGQRGKIKAENVVIIGARSIDRGEAEMIKQKGITLYTAREVRKLGMEEVMRGTVDYLSRRTDGVHLSLDLDSLDPAVAPGVGTPVPGGFSAEETKIAMTVLNRANLLTSVEIVELNPSLDEDNKTARKAVTLASLLLQNNKSQPVQAGKGKKSGDQPRTN